MLSNGEIMIKRISLVLTALLGLGHVSSAYALTSFKETALKSSSVQVPYFMQRYNKYEPGGTCGLTSAAMLLNYWAEKKPEKLSKTTPDSLYLKYGKFQGQSPINLADLYMSHNLENVYSYYGTRAEIKRALDLGRPVIVHGWFTKNGHIIVLTGYTNEGFIVNDPAGNWLRCYKCGYAKGTNGKQRIYRYGELSSSVLGKDGDIWYSYAF